MLADGKNGSQRDELELLEFFEENRFVSASKFANLNVVTNLWADAETFSVRMQWKSQFKKFILQTSALEWEVLLEGTLNGEL